MISYLSILYTIMLFNSSLLCTTMIFNLLLLLLCSIMMFNLSSLCSIMISYLLLLLYTTIYYLLLLCSIMIFNLSSLCSIMISNCQCNLIPFPPAHWNMIEKVCFPWCDPCDSRSAMIALRLSHELQQGK